MRRFLVFCVSLWGVATAWAQTTSDQTSPGADQLQSVTVTAKRLEEELPQILAVQGVRVDTISAQSIANGGYVDLATALEFLAPGLNISPKNGPFDYVAASIQGMPTEDILWLVDGVRINNRLYGGTTPLDTVPASIVDQVQVLEGGEALFYGTQAAAGAVNILTKAFSDTPDGQVSVGGDTNESGHFDGYYRDTVDGNHFVVYADVDVSHGFQPFRNQDYQPSGSDRNRDYRVYTGGAKYAYDFTDSLRFTTLYQHTSGKVDFAFPFLTNQAYNNRDEDIISAKLDFTPSDNFQLFGKAYYHRWDSHYTEYDNVIGSPGQLSVSEAYGFWGFSDRGFNLMSKFKLNSLFDEVVGYDFQNYTGRDAVLVIGQQTESVNAVFGQIATSSELMAHSIIAAGVRYDDPTVGPSAAVWSLSGKHDFSDDFFIRGLIGTAFRLPTAEELFANDPDDERGDPNLKPEQSKNLNVSVGGYLDGQRFKWELIGFVRNITDLITYTGFDATTDQDLFGNLPGTVHVRGGELDLTQKLGDVSLEESYTYSHSVQDGLQIDAVPVQQGKVAFDYHPASLPFGLTVTALYVGKEFNSAMWDGRESYGKYPVFDLAGRYYLDQKRQQTLSFRLANVFDRVYATSLGNGELDATGGGYTYWNVGVPRTFEARYTYHF
jgi:outer membrane cobalamin receptor